MKEIDDIRKIIKKLYDKTNDPNIKRRCALALVALNLTIEYDSTTEEDTPF
jgi:hypothetical protein